MEEAPGERPGTRRFFHGGYAYHFDVREGDLGQNNLYRCASRTRSLCRGTARVERGNVIVISPHDQHAPNPNIVEEARMKGELLELARGTLRAFRQLHDEVAARYVEICQRL